MPTSIPGAGSGCRCGGIAGHALQLDHRHAGTVDLLADLIGIGGQAVAVGLAFMAFYSLVWLIRKIRQRPEEVVRDVEAHALSDIAD